MKNGEMKNTKPKDKEIVKVGQELVAYGKALIETSQPNSVLYDLSEQLNNLSEKLRILYKRDL